MKINEDNLYFVDTETGGLKYYINGLCSICIKKYNSNYVRNMFFFPQKKIYEFGAFQVNHLSLEELYRNGVSREDLIKTIYSLYESKGEKLNYLIFAGWNVTFDTDFILQVFKEKKSKLPCPIIALDLKEVAAANIKKKDMRKKEDDGVENYRLTTIYQHFFNDFEEEKAHTAEYDCFMVEKLYDLFKEKGWI